MSGYTADVIAHRGVLDDEVQFIAKPFSTGISPSGSMPSWSRGSLSLAGSCERDEDCERGPFPRGAVHVDRAPVLAHDAGNRGKADARTRPGPACEEGLEQPGTGLGVHPHPGVPHAEPGKTPCRGSIRGGVPRAFATVSTSMLKVPPSGIASRAFPAR